MKMAMRMAAAASLALAACSSTTEPQGPPSRLDKLPRDLTAAEQAVLSASNGFAFDILRETAAADSRPNVLLSPLSAQLVLSMTMNGAAGATLDEMRDALHFNDRSLQEINAANESLTELLLGLDRAVDIRIANSIWANRGFPFEQSFFDTARRWYSAQVATLDFGAASAAPTINDWVDRSTRGRISSIVDDPLPGDAVMYLINAVYFKGSWRDRFDPGYTRDAPFMLADGSSRNVRMMNREGPALHHVTPDGTQILEQLYSRGAFAMTIVLPPEGRSVDELIASLSAQQWDAWMQQLTETEVEISVPKYRVEYETVMNPALQALGMRAAFSPMDSDFTPMSPAGRDLYIDEVKQKTYMDVNEEGTEAAAVTSVGVRVTSAPVRPRFVADRPFLVAIRERLSGTIMFIGKIGAPG